MQVQLLPDGLGWLVRLSVQDGGPASRKGEFDSGTVAKPWTVGH